MTLFLICKLFSFFFYYSCSLLFFYLFDIITVLIFFYYFLHINEVWIIIISVFYKCFDGQNKIMEHNFYTGQLTHFSHIYGRIIHPQREMRHSHSSISMFFVHFHSFLIVLLSMYIIFLSVLLMYATSNFSVLILVIYLYHSIFFIYLYFYYLSHCFLVISHSVFFLSSLNIFIS